jgi:group I intron endonuclease
MNIYSIYKSTNIITGECYIGFDSNWPRRKKYHKRFSKKQNNYKFYNAIRKYGWDNFEWEVIYQSKDDRHTLNTMENFFIIEYNSFNNGYNSTLGGDGTIGYKHTEETKQKMKKPKSKESVVKRVDSNSKEWIVTDPTGKQYQIKNLNRFCKENNLCCGNMQYVALGKYKQHKGWNCSRD